MVRSRREREFGGTPELWKKLTEADSAIADAQDALSAAALARARAMYELLDEGVTKADMARKLGLTPQAIGGVFARYWCGMGYRLMWSQYPGPSPTWRGMLKLSPFWRDVAYCQCRIIDLHTTV